ncbi:MAG: FtsQ-type POTRA domain-containing protein [Acidobacteriota bacterium]|nr:FtsQ-type POTRA domain-containing protein [Acidobacteriota bacterium]
MNRTGTPSDDARFQRGRAGMRVKKTRRTFAFRFRHAIGLLVGAALLFFAAYEIYAFVITWPKLEVREIRTACPDPEVAALAAQAMESRAWGNLLLLDMSRVRAEARTVPWVKDARIRKVFPASLAVDVVPRRAAALLERATVVLVDEEGVVIEPSSREARPDLPLFIDQNRFADDGEAKMRLALACWYDLRPEDRGLIDTIDVSATADIVVRFRGSETRVRLGDAQFGARTAEYLGSRDRWEAAFGPLESVLLALPNRVVLRPRPAATTPSPAPSREGE